MNSKLVIIQFIYTHNTPLFCTTHLSTVATDESRRAMYMMLSTPVQFLLLGSSYLRKHSKSRMVDWFKK